MFLRIIIVCLISFYSVLAYGQETYLLTGNIKQLAGKKVELLDLHVGKTSVIGSTTISSYGNFQFNLKRDLPVGFYKLKFDERKFIDIIFNHENIQFYANLPRGKDLVFIPLESIRILSSEENRIYYDYLKSITRIQNKSNHLKKLKKLYQSDQQLKSNITGHDTKAALQTSSFYNQIEEELKNLENQMLARIDRLISSNPGTYAVKIIKTLQLPQVNKKLSILDQNKYLKDHFFDNVDFDDKTLLNSSVLPMKISKYFDLYKNYGLNAEQQEEEFIKASNVIISIVKNNEIVFNFVLDAIFDKFEKSVFENLLTYLTENYDLKGSCANNEGLSSLNKTEDLKLKIERIRSLAISKPAPDVLIQENNKYKKLADIKVDCTLILFWESTCPHCVRLLPRLKEVYDQYREKGFEVLAISIDEDKDLWDDVLENGHYGWINSLELKGRDSKTAKDYNIWSTPKMYLLDKEKKIKAKPRTIEELESLILTIL